MGTWNLTLFEYHNHDGTVDRFSHPDNDGRAREATAPESGGSGRGVGIVLGLAFLIGVGIALRYLRADEETDAGRPRTVSLTEYEE